MSLLARLSTSCFLTRPVCDIRKQLVLLKEGGDIPFFDSGICERNPLMREDIVLLMFVHSAGRKETRRQSGESSTSFDARSCDIILLRKSGFEYAPVAGMSI